MTGHTAPYPPVASPPPAANPGRVLVVPCSAAKLSRRASARHLYTGPVFRDSFAAAEAEAARNAGSGPAARVLILSALHGLIDPGHEVDPYDMTMTDPGSVSAGTIAAQARAFGIGPGTAVRAFLPRLYLARLTRALEPAGIRVQDVYAGCRGIGDQRHVNALIRQGHSPS